jgi:polysaccharide export outer membrane protein
MFVRVLLWFIIASLAGLTAAWAEPQTTNTGEASSSFSLSSYRLGVGDVISIRVFGEDDMNMDKVSISDSGVITLPFGDVKVLGLTPSELGKTIEAGLRGNYLKNPSVSVTMVQYRSFFIYGQVAKPGGIPYEPGLTIRKAVALAGGFTVRASEDKIYVVRDNDPSHTPTKVGLDASIMPGDTVNIEESFF